MKIFFVLTLTLLILPVMVLAADDLSFSAETNLTVGGYTLTVINGTTDQMVVGADSVTFTLSANSGLIIRSYDKHVLGNNLGIDILCASSYSQISVSGTSLGTSLIVTPSNDVCVGATGGGSVVSSGGGGGGGGAAVVSTPTVTMPTTTTGEVTVTASGGKTSLTADENMTASVELPASAVSASTAVKIEKVVKGTATVSRPVSSDRSMVGSYVYNYTATANGTAVSTFSKNVTLTMTYTDAQISGLQESALKIAYWNDTSNQWIELPTKVNASNNVLTAETSHFTYFAILGSEEIVVTEATSAVTIVDGDLVRNPNAEGMAQFDIYIVKIVGSKKFKRLILSPHVFESYSHFDKNGNGTPWDDVKDISQSQMSEYTTSDLVRADGDTKVYKLTAAGDMGAKQWLNMTAAQFTTQGYDADSIYTINNTDKNAYTTGVDITVSE